MWWWICFSSTMYSRKISGQSTNTEKQRTAHINKIRATYHSQNSYQCRCNYWHKPTKCSLVFCDMLYVWSLIPKWVFHSVCWLGYYIIWTCVEFHICKHFIMDTGNVFHWNASKVQIHLMLWAVNLLFDADVTEWILTSACEQSCACVCKQPVTLPTPVAWTGPRYI